MGFGIPELPMHQWIRGENEIQEGKKGRKRVKGGSRKAFWPDMEKKPVEEFKLLLQKGLKVKHYWLKAHAHQLMHEMHPYDDFCFSPG